MIGSYLLTHNRTIIYTFDPADLQECLRVGAARAEIKRGVARDDSYTKGLAGYDPRVPHMLGHRAEWAFCRLLGIDPPRDISRGGDGHRADVFFPYIRRSFEIKYNDYGGPDPAFAIATTNKADFRADFGVLLKRVKGSRKRDPYNQFIEFFGYVDRETFMRKSHIRDFKFGPRLVVDAADLTPFMGFLDRLISYHQRVKAIQNRSNLEPS